MPVRPFLQEIWSALHAKSTTLRSAGMVWVKQIDHSLSWLRAFFVSNTLQIERLYTLDAYHGHGEHFTMGIDASPTGVGGWLEVNGSITPYFSMPLSATDESILGHKRGDCRGQQVWEFLAVLISLRQWVSDSRRLHLRLIGDNVGALTLALKLRPKCRYMAVLAREVSLILANMPFPPSVIHTPGIANVLADKLSRLHDGKNVDVLQHPALASAKRVFPAQRKRGWYRTLKKFRG